MRLSTWVCTGSVCAACGYVCVRCLLPTHLEHGCHSAGLKIVQQALSSPHLQSATVEHQIKHVQLLETLLSETYNRLQTSKRA